MPFQDDDHWLKFCHWIASVGPEKAREIMSAYIEQNFEHFCQFVENQYCYRSPHDPPQK